MRHKALLHAGKLVRHEQVFQLADLTSGFVRIEQGFGANRVGTDDAFLGNFVHLRAQITQQFFGGTVGQTPLVFTRQDTARRFQDVLGQQRMGIAMELAEYAHSNTRRKEHLHRIDVDQILLLLHIVTAHAQEQYPSVLVKPVAINLPAKGKLGIALDDIGAGTAQLVVVDLRRVMRNNRLLYLMEEIFFGQVAIVLRLDGTVFTQCHDRIERNKVRDTFGAGTLHDIFLLDERFDVVETSEHIEVGALEILLCHVFDFDI